MATDTTGFRSLVQQIQEREPTYEQAALPRERGAMTREPRRDLPRRTRSRNDAPMLETLSSGPKGGEQATLLCRRWL